MKKNLLLFVDFIKDIEIKHLIRIMRLSVFLILVSILVLTQRSLIRRIFGSQLQRKQSHWIN